MNTHICNKMQIPCVEPMDNKNTVSTMMCCCKDNTCITECNIAESHCWHKNTLSSPNHWGEHIHYVTLSRVMSLNGLHLCNLNPEKNKVSHRVTKYLTHVLNIILWYCHMNQSIHCKTWYFMNGLQQCKN